MAKTDSGKMQSQCQSCSAGGQKKSQDKDQGLGTWLGSSKAVGNSGLGSVPAFVLPSSKSNGANRGNGGGNSAGGGSRGAGGSAGLPGRMSLDDILEDIEEREQQGMFPKGTAKKMKQQLKGSGKWKPSAVSGSTT